MENHQTGKSTLAGMERLPVQDRSQRSRLSFADAETRTVCKWPPGGEFYRLCWWQRQWFAEFSGNVAVEAVTFPDEAQFDDQFDQNATLSSNATMKARLERWRRSIDRAAVPARRQRGFENREHADIRELLWFHVDGDNEWRVGSQHHVLGGRRIAITWWT